MAQALIGALRVDLGMRTAAFEKGVTEAQKRLKSMERSLKRTARKMQRVGQTMTLGLTGPLAAIGVTATKTAMKYREAAAQVEQGLTTMGDASGKTFEALIADAERLEKTSLFTRQDILGTVTANMLTFGNVSGDAFDRAQQAALDLSQRLGQDLKSSTIQIGKALNDPIRGVTALSRVGVQFTDDQRDMIKAMVEAGDVASAQGMILSELEKQYAGSAQAAQDAAPGDEIQDAWNDFRLTLGEIIVKILPPLTEALANLINKFNGLSPSMQKGVIIAGAVVAALGPVIATLGTLIGMLPALAAGVVALAGPFGVILALLTGAAGLIYAMEKYGSNTAATRREHKDLFDLLQSSKPIIDQQISSNLDVAKSQIEVAKAARETLKEELALARQREQEALAEARRLAKVANTSQGRLGDAAGTKLLGRSRQAERATAIIAEGEKRLAELDAKIAEAQRAIESPSAVSRTTGQAVSLPTPNEVPQRTANTAAIQSETQARRDSIAAQMAELDAAQRADEAKQQAAMRRMQGHVDATRAAIQEAQANRELAAAYRVSAQEGRLVAEMQALQASGVQLTTDKLRALAQESLAASDAMQTAMNDATQSAQTAGNTMVDAFTKGANAFTGLINAIKSGDIGSILQQGMGFLNQLFGSSGSSAGFGGGGSGGGLGAFVSKFAGFFDKGGTIPAGKFGFAGENGPELIRGPASVLSTANTAKMMSKMTAGGSSAPAIRFEVVPAKGDVFDATVQQISGRAATPIAQAHSQGAVQRAQRSTAKRSGRRLGPPR
jgi:hypothetical protein